MAGCCGHDAQFDGVSRVYKRRLWMVIAINAAMFAVEMAAGQHAQSQALKAVSLNERPEGRMSFSGVTGGGGAAVRGHALDRRGGKVEAARAKARKRKDRARQGALRRRWLRCRHSPTLVALSAFADGRPASCAVSFPSLPGLE